MAKRLSEVRATLKEVIESNVDGMRVYETRPSSVVVPALVIQPKQKFVEYLVGMGNSIVAIFHLEALLLASKISDKASQNRLDDLMSPDGELIPILQSLRVKGLINISTAVSGSGYGFYQVGSTDYLGCLIDLDIQTY